ncbi:MAG: hypothetical protein IKI28_09120 [Bacteroidales bacterium]|nr:hypothetical protein [Bacteroidales bacterium]
MGHLGIKQLLLLAIFCAPMGLFAQQEICGVKFGASIDVARSILDQKFGSANVTESHNVLEYNDVRYAGYVWNRIRFVFQRDGKNSYCISCQMLKACSDLESAKKLRDELQAKMANKYEMNMFTDADGLEYYKGGVSPTDKSDYGFRLEIDKSINRHLNVLAEVLHDLLGEAVIDVCAVVLTYGPYNYVNEEL